MSVFYKFKNTLEFDIVTFDGLHISVADLKTCIMQQKKMGKSSDFDLQISNDQTKEVYENDELFIPKNTSVIVARIPVTAERAAVSSKSKNLRKPQDLHFPADLSSDLVNSNASEADKVKAIISQSSQEYDPSMYLKGRNMTGPIPPNYTCYKCGRKGHWIYNCPNGNIKRSKGIPRSFMVPVDGPDHIGALLTSSGEYAVPLIDHVAYREVKKEKPCFGNVVKLELEPEVQIPEDLVCLLCRDLLHDAVLSPCCGNSFCDECLREAVLNSDNHECPLCHEDGVSPDSIIPNRFLRRAVLTFTNDTGHTKVRQITSSRFLQSSDVDSAQSSADSVAHNPAVPSKPVVKEAVPAEDGTAIPSTTVIAFENVDLEQSVAVESIQHLADPLVQDKTERKVLDCNETMESMQNRRVRGEIDKNVENERDETLQCIRQFSCPSVQDKDQESIEFQCTQTLESTQLYPDPSVQGQSAENVDPECSETLEFFQQPPVTRIQEKTEENVNIRSINDRMHKVAKAPQTRSSRDLRARTRNPSCSPSRTRTSSRPPSFRTSRSLSGTVSHSSVPRSHSTHSLSRSRSRSKARSYFRSRSRSYSRSRSRSYSRSRSRSYSKSRSRSYSRSRSRRRSFFRDRVRHQRDIDTPSRKTFRSRYHRSPLRVKHSYISSYEHSYSPQYGAPPLLPPAFVPPPTVLPPGVMVPHASQEMYGVQPTTYLAPVGYYNASEYYPQRSSVSGHDYDNQYHGYNSYHKSAFSQMYEPGNEGGFNEPPLQEQPMHGEETTLRIPVLIGNRGRGGKYAYQQQRDPWEHEKIYTADVQQHQMGYFPSDIQRNEKAIVHKPVSPESCKPRKRESVSYEKSLHRKPFTGIHDDLQRGAEVSRSDGTDRFRNLSVAVYKDKRRVHETEKSENRPSLKGEHSSSKRLKLHRSRKEFASSNISHDTQRAMEYKAIDTKSGPKHDWQKSFRDGEIKDLMCVAHQTLVSKRPNEHRRQFCKERNDHRVQEYSNCDYSYPDDFSRKKYENSNKFHKRISRETKFYDCHAPRDQDNRRKQGCGIQSNQIADVRARNTERRDVEHLSINQSRSISNDSGENYSSMRKQVVKKHHRSKCSGRSYEHRFKKRDTSQVSVNESVKSNMQSRIDDSKVSNDAISKSCHGANTVKSESREKHGNKGSKRSCSTAPDTHSKRMKQDTHTASTSLNLSESRRRKSTNASHEEKEAASIKQNSCRKDDDRNSSVSEGARKDSKFESPERKHKHKKKQKKHKKHKHQNKKKHKKHKHQNQKKHKKHKHQKQKNHKKK